MDSVSFTVLGEPTGKGRPKFNSYTRSAYTPKKTVNYETWVKMEYCRQCKKKKQMKLDNIIRPTKKPDMDNIVKIIADPLNGIAYHDDSQIVNCSIKKFFSDQPRVEVKIKEV